MVSAIKFLENPNPPKDASSYQLPSKATITRNLKELHCQLYPENIEKDGEIKVESTLPDTCALEKKAAYDEFLDFIKKPDICNYQSDTWTCLLQEVKKLLLSQILTLALRQFHLHQLRPKGYFL